MKKKFAKGRRIPIQLQEQIYEKLRGVLKEGIGKKDKICDDVLIQRTVRRKKDK